MADDTATYDADFTLSANLFTRPGYTFSHWNTEFDNSGTSYADEYEFTPWKIADDLVLYAQWEAIDIDVIYILVGSTQYTSEVAKYDSMLSSAPTAPNRTGYRFLGWYTGVNGSGLAWVFDEFTGTPLTVANGVNLTTESLTLYAYWAMRIPYNVSVVGSYDVNSGANTYESGDVVVVNAGVRAGYTFAGWTVSDGVVLDDASSATASFVMPGKNVSLVANWESGGSNETIELPDLPNILPPPVRPR